MFAIKVSRVDFENFDDQFVNVFGKQFQFNRIFDGEEFLVRSSKVQVNSFQQSLVLRRRQHRSPRFTVSVAGKDLGRGELTFQIVTFKVFGKCVGVGSRFEKVM